MTAYRCIECKAEYPGFGLPIICPGCGGSFNLTDLTYCQPDDRQEGIWRYQAAFGLPEIQRPIYLGEGSTALVPSKFDGKQVFLKCEHLNPSGSFKDRGTAILASLLRSRQITEVVEDSSGNAGASLALYSAPAGLKSTVYVPASTSGPKLNQIKAIGVGVLPVEGPREAAHQAVEQAVHTGGKAYASHAYLPFHLAGYATILFEVFEQLGIMPGTVVAPIGHGSLFLGLVLAGESLQKAGLGKRPKFIGVQPANCAPVVTAWRGEKFEGTQGTSIAEGTQVSRPARGKEILDHLIQGEDQLLEIPEKEIIEAHQQLVSHGFYVEPTSAMVMAGVKGKLEDLPAPIVFVLTGSGLKFNQSIY